MVGQCPLSEAEKVYACLSLSCGSWLSAHLSLAKALIGKNNDIDSGVYEESIGFAFNCIPGTFSC